MVAVSNYNIPPNTINLFRTILKRVAPPPKLTISQWADEYRMLSSEASAEPGQWRTDRAPFQREIMDAISDPVVETVVVMSSAQVGKTEILLNTLGYYIHYDPSPMMLVQPQLEIAEAFSKDRLAPMIRDTRVLTGKVKDIKSKSSGNTILHKTFPGGHLTMGGANSPASLCSRPIRILLGDELDRWPDSAGTEGDPVDLASKRTNNFWNRKKVFVSTPTDKGTSRIEELYEESSMELYHLPCPRCGEYQPLTWAQIWFIDKDHDFVTHECKYCHERSGEVAWKENEGRWVARQENAECRGFHLNELLSTWKTWEKIVVEFKKALKAGPKQYKVWVNTSLGESWVEKGDAVEHEKLFERRELYNCEVPDDVLVVTAAVDVQENRLECEAVGWGIGCESWGLEYKNFFGDPKQKAVWQLLDDYLQKTFSYVNGTKISITCVCVDSGYLADEVYKFTKEREYRRIYSVKGSSISTAPLVGKHSTSNRRSAILFPIGVDTGKNTMMQNLKVDDPGPGYCHFPLDEGHGYTEDYFKALTSEKRILTYIKGRPVYKWVKKSGARNEAFDIRNYNLAALEILNPNLELLANRPRGDYYKQSKTSQSGKRSIKRRVISKGI